MSIFQSRAFCPQCKTNAIFTRAERLGTCANCGFQYPLYSGSLPEDMERVDRPVISEIPRAFLIIMAALLLSVAVLVLMALA